MGGKPGKGSMIIPSERLPVFRYYQKYLLMKAFSGEGEIVVGLGNHTSRMKPFEKENFYINTNSVRIRELGNIDDTYG